jgi:hypothetical protein
LIPFFILAATQWVKATYCDPAGTEDQLSQLEAAATADPAAGTSVPVPLLVLLQAEMTRAALRTAPATVSHRPRGFMSNPTSFASEAVWRCAR